MGIPIESAIKTAPVSMIISNPGNCDFTLAIILSPSICGMLISEIIMSGLTPLISSNPSTSL